MKKTVLASLACTFLLLTATLTSIAAAQTFNISPANPVLQGDPMSIVLKGLAPNANVKIVAERPFASWGAAKSMIYRSEAVFTANASGEIDLATTPAIPRSGTYKGADIRGLFWSMLPTKTESPKDAKPSTVTLTASIDDKDIATTAITFIAHSPQLTVEKLEKFPGAIFTTLPGVGKRAAMIVLGGSEGGNSSVNDSAKRFASRGFAVMSLPYYSPKQWPNMKQEVPELPANFVNIEINRLNEARDYLRTRADVDGERIAIYGVSKGAEFVLLAATNFAWVKSAVAVVPTDIVWEGWGEGVPAGKTASFAKSGKPFPFTPYKEFSEEMMGFQTGADVRIRRPQDKGRAANPAAAATARIPIEKYKGALLVIGGQDDQIWNSAMMAHNIAERRAAVAPPAKRETVSRIYTDAGHYLSGNGWTPTTQYDIGPNKSGGTPEGNARAQADAWETTLQFLRRTLDVK